MLSVLVGALLAATTVGLHDDPAATSVELAGPDVLVLTDRREGGAHLLAVPRAGGPARTLLTVDAARPTWPIEEGLSASDRRVALFVEIGDRRDRTVEWRVYAGPPEGPLEILRRTPDRGIRTWVPLLVDVDGERVLLIESPDQGGPVRAQVFDPVFGVVPIAWASESMAPVAIAGDYAAAVARRPYRVAVVDLATGTELAAIPLPRHRSELGIDLAADGRIVAVSRTGLATARPGEPPVSLPSSEGLTSPRFAGDAIVAVEDGHPVVVEPSRQRLGPPSRVFTRMAADDRGVTWLANGCVRHSTFGAPIPQTADPCPSTEIGFYLITSSRLRGRRIRVPVHCVAATSGTCRGTVLARLGRRVVGRASFAVPAGAERRVPMRLTRRVAARFRRERFGSLIIDARVPDGRIGAGADGSAELSVKVRPSSR